MRQASVISLAIAGTIAASLALYSLSTPSPASLSLFRFQHSATSSDEAEFFNFMSLYNKVYQTREEFENRKGIFLSNLKAVRSAALGHELGLNEFADFSQEEFRARFSSLTGESAASENAVQKKSRRGLASDSSHEITLTNEIQYVDWRDKGAVNTAVLAMWQCASGHLYNTIASMEGAHAIQHGVLYELAIQ